MKVAISKNDPVNAVEDVTVNGVLISEDQISREAQNHPGPHWKAACDAATRALVIKELLLQEARSGNVCKDAASKALEGDEQDEEALIEALIQSNVQVPVAEQDECHRYYCNNPGKFNSGPSFQARHILIRIASDASDDVNRANRKAKQIIEQLNKSPERFAEFSSLHSACPSSESGGDLGKIGRGSTAPEFEHALEAMKEGEISSQPVRTRYGFHIIALDTREEGKMRPFEEVSELISTWLGAKAWARATSQYIAMLAGKADIEGFAMESSDGALVQ